MSYLSSTGPQWVKVATLAYTAFSTAGLVSTIASGYSLPAKGVIHGCMVIPTTLFSGGTIASYTISVGIGSGGSVAKYAVATNVFTGATLATPNVLPGIESTSAAVSITATATSVTGLLNAASAGSADIYLLIGQLI